MNVFLWILQAVLALHTAIGAVWKLSNPAQTVPSLQAIPVGAWQALSGLEIVCALALVVPAFYKPLAFLAPYAAALIAAEMLLFCGLHVASGDANFGPMIYWLVALLVCALVAYGRFVLKPFV